MERDRSSNWLERRRLLALLASTRIGAIEAGGGYGKSVLANEYGRDLGIATVVATVSPGATDAAGLLNTIRRALRSARLSDLAASLSGGGLAPGARIELLLELLAASTEPLLLVLDDVHRLTGAEPSELVLRLSDSIPTPHRLLVVARRLQAPLEQLRSAPGVTLLGAKQLEFSERETTLLFAQAGVQLPPQQLKTIHEATGGWAAALAIAVSMLAASDNPAASAEQLLRSGDAALNTLLEGVLGALDAPRREAVVQLAHLPLLSGAVADAVIGSQDALGGLASAGIPLSRSPSGWWTMPGPVLDQLRARAALDGGVASTAAGVYLAEGEAREAIHTLLAARLHDAAAAALAQLPVARVEQLGCEEIAGVVASLPEPAVARHAGILLHLARVAEAEYRADLRREALSRVAVLAAAGSLDERIRNEFDAERARDMLWEQDTRPQAETLAEAVVARAALDHTIARARALDVLGRARCWMTARGPRDRAERLIDDSVRLSRSIGARTWAAQALVPLAWGVHFATCRFDRALATLDDALSDLPMRNRYRALVLTFRADVLTELARTVEAEATISEIRGIGEAFGVEWALAFGAWAEARLASYAADAERTMRAVVDVERHRGEWYEQVGGMEFLAHAADMLDRVGQHALALSYLERAHDRAPQFDRPVRLFGASVHARSGDPQLGAKLIGEMLEREDLERQERWWLELLLAFAAKRQGLPDGEVGRLAATAFDRCLEFGHTIGPAVREAAVSETLLPLAVAAGSRSAARLRSGAQHLSVTLLGGFELRRGGRIVAPPSGRPAMAVRIVAARGGRIGLEELSELLWPHATPSAARNRMRNLLSRVTSAAGPVLVRDGEDIALVSGATIDTTRFELEAAEALRLHVAGETDRAAVLARAALGRYRGELLPGDRYADWATIPRERLRALQLEILDLTIDDAERREEIDEAVRLLQRAIDVEPYDERRYLRLAQLLVSQGRAGSARATLRRARAALSELGLTPSPMLESLERLGAVE